MKKIISLLLAVLMLSVMFAGCGVPKNAADLLPADANSDKTAEEAGNEPDDAPANNSGAASGGTAAESYAAYLEAKNVVITKLTEGLSNSTEAGMAVLSFMGVAMIDLAILPASFFGMGQESVQMGLAVLGGSDVKYTENGNSYTMEYTSTDQDGNVQSLVFSGTYDAAADALVCTGSTDGADNIYSEYHKTSFGYVGQYYFLNDDGTTSVYMIAVDGENGTVGISLNTDKPAALTGSEGPDFPKACAEWYSINGTTITGKTSDGTELNFEYTPTETE